MTYCNTHANNSFMNTNAALHTLNLPSTSSVLMSLFQYICCNFLFKNFYTVQYYLTLCYFMSELDLIRDGLRTMRNCVSKSLLNTEILTPVKCPLTLSQGVNHIVDFHLICVIMNISGIFIKFFVLNPKEHN